MIQPLVTDAFLGYNCSIFTYGQTGSGMYFVMIIIITIMITIIILTIIIIIIMITIIIINIIFYS